MALSILRSCIKSRLTIGVSRQLIVLESKVTCPERHAPGPFIHSRSHFCRINTI